MNKIDLKKFPFFSGIPAEKTEQLTQKFCPIKIKKRQQLQLIKDMEDAVYFVSEGRIKISYFSECGKEFIITVLEPGGIYSFHSEAISSALTDSLVWLISMRDFRNILIDFPMLNFRLYRLLGEILKSYNDLVLNLAFREVSSRLAKYLFENQLDEEWTALTLTHEELAFHLGTTRQTISSTLSRWERQKIIQLRRGYVKILNRKDLKKLV